MAGIDNVAFKHCTLRFYWLIAANIDASLMRFLQKYFPKETKVKQKENEIAVGVDLYGESYADAKCIVMWSGLYESYNTMIPTQRTICFNWAMLYII